MTYINFPLVYDVEVVSFVPLLDDDLASVSVHGEHGIEDVAAQNNNNDNDVGLHVLRCWVDILGTNCNEIITIILHSSCRLQTFQKQNSMH